MAESRPLRIALIGCGNHSRVHHGEPMALYAREHPGDVELVAACDLDADRAETFARELGFAAAFTDIDEMLIEMEPDGVVCVMPIAHTVDMAVRLLGAGVTCTIEKPLGESLGAAHRLASAAAETGTPHMVSLNRRFWPLLARATDWIGDRPVRHIRAGIYRKKRVEPHFIWGTAIHPVDAVVHLAGPITGWDARLIEAPDLDTRWFDVSLEFEGCRGEVLVAPSSGRTDEVYELFGEDFCAVVSMNREISGYVECFEAGQSVLREETPPGIDSWLISGAYEEFAAFLKAIRGETPFRPSVADAMSATEACFDIAAQFGE